jgi:DNA (cytosine-5)-methyltransferase 1
MTHGSLFSGIGGFDLASEWMGWENIFHCEINKFGKQVLKYYWPNAISYDDITKTDFSIHRGRIDILTGGFPCQPYSIAGKRKGKEDDRHLWPEMLRAIREIQPRYVVGENVRGLTNWNGGVVFDEVQSDLENQGYEVLPFLLPACSVNAPHRRDRIWFVAYASGFNGSISIQQRRQNEDSHVNINRNVEKKIAPNPENIGLQFTGNSRERWSGFKNDNSNGIDTDSSSAGQQECNATFFSNKQRHGSRLSVEDWSIFPTQSPVCDGNDGVSTHTHIRAFSNENIMDRSVVITNAINSGRITVDFETGKVYSTRQRGKEGQSIELLGADCNGYIVHNIMFDGIKKQCRAHQIVWIAANGLYDKETLMIDHVNRNKKDNRLSNLRLVDAKGNSENRIPHQDKLNQEEKDKMFFLYKEGNVTMRELSEDFGISKSRVQQILSEHDGLYGITFPKWRNESIKAAGNAIVPQVAFEIFKAIEKYEQL